METILNLHLFDQYTQTTLLNSTGNDLSAEMKTYYEKRLLDSAEPNLVHDQFGTKYPIPKNGGKTIEFRKYSALGKALTPLTEGVTPAGNKLNVDTILATVDQYGDWIQISDILDLTAIDRNVEQATRLLGAQAGRTLDTITREVLMGGTNVQFAPSAAALATPIKRRVDLKGDCLLTIDAVLKAVAELRAMNAPTINGDYVGIIHPYVAADLMRSEKWQDWHKYTTAEDMYNGEIGKIGGVRFVETTEAKIIGAGVIGDGINKLTVKTAISSSSTSVVVNETLTAVTPAKAIPIYIGGVANTITKIEANSGGGSKITIGTAITAAAAGDAIYGAGATPSGASVFCTLIVGAEAYGVTEVSGGGLQHIVKQLGYGDDPLNQRSSTGWKAIKTAERLSEEYMIRIEHCSDTGMYAKSN